NYTIDTANLQTGKKPYAVKLKGVKTASDVGIVRYVPNTKSEQLAFGTGEDGVPSVFTLEQNYPNPFNPTTAIRFEVGGLGLVSLKIYNVLGQEVATLIHSRLMEEGMHEIEFDASSLSSGVYFYRLTSSSETKTFIDVKKMMLMK
ncbi:MAG: T9SS type A sorting domain-containing protein, partial [Ignavibacteriales bacterium]|nr:T9SS type A sorting domain-containing protein [Ignavibacteriales bacterium]